MWRPDEPHIHVRDDIDGDQAIDDDTEHFIPLKKLSLNPPCLQFDELALLSSSIERIRAYTRKMQELTTYDTGLQDWMAYQKDRSEFGSQLVFHCLPMERNYTAQTHATLSYD